MIWAAHHAPHPHRQTGLVDDATILFDGVAQHDEQPPDRRKNARRVVELLVEEDRP